jgi:flagellar basal-body rod modification protein FlgD
MTSTTNPILGSASAAPSTTSSSSARIPTKTLDQTDFIKVLIANLGQQDPFKAADSTKFFDDFMNMANFDAMQGMSKNVQKVYDQQQYLLSQSILGKMVEVKSDAGDSDTGIVASSQVSGADVQVSVNGKLYTTSNIVKILNN